MVYLFSLVLGDNRRPGHQKVSGTIQTVYTMSDRIPEFGNLLPLVNQPWRVAFKKPLYVDFSQCRHAI